MASDPVPGLFATLATDGDDPTARYVDEGPIGQGSIAEVRRVRDRVLGRAVALKILEPRHAASGAMVARFVAEAQATAQLDHPGIVSVHELGSLDDGRHYYTMDLVRGRTLGEVFAELHRHATGGDWRRTPSGWALRSCVDALRAVADAVGHAHQRGVIHRDLKPANVMVGPHRTVVVMDWGIAKVRGVKDPEVLDPVVTDRSQDDALATRVGAVAGTPAYMSPEQARGDVDAIGPAADVYALGAMLYELLGRRRPYVGSDAHSVLRKVLEGPPEPLEARQTPSTVDTFLFGLEMSEAAMPEGPPIPEALRAVCERAMARDPADRHPDGTALANDLLAWLDGDAARSRAGSLVERADALAKRIDGLEADAAALRQEASGMLSALGAAADISAKRPAWRLEDAAEELDRRIRVEQARRVEMLQAALREDPSLDDAHARLADHYQGLHAEAERNRDRPSAAAWERLLRVHDRGEHAAWLEGSAHLSLSVAVDGARLVVRPLRPLDRRLEAGRPVWQGAAPLVDLPLRAGGYVVEVTAPGRAMVTVPVSLERAGTWDTTPPGQGAPRPVTLPRADRLGPDDVFIPGGWFWFGGDPHIPSLPRRRLWVDDFVIQRHPITNRDYIAFLDDLVARGDEALALRYVPRSRGPAHGIAGEMCYGRRDDGTFELVEDADGDLWHPDWPVIMVDHPSMSAYAAWRAEADGLPWRLVDEVRWEKAARGVDGRYYPWGDHLEASWACVRASHGDGRMLPASVDAYPDDVSVYGVRHLAGNLCDWCLDPFETDGPRVDPYRPVPWPVPPADAPENAWYVGRGGHWFATPQAARVCHRYADAGTNRDAILSFRLARPLVADDR